MSRRRRAEVREIQPDPVYNSTLAEKFVNNMMWDGKKTVAQGIFYGAMDRLRDRAGVWCSDMGNLQTGDDDSAIPARAEREARLGAGRGKRHLVLWTSTRAGRHTCRANRFVLRSSRW